MSSFWARDSQSFNQGKGGPMTTNTGFGDVSLFVKYRPIIQTPDPPPPSVTLYSQVALPSSRWTGTERPRGGFAPIGRLPSTRFGELGFTEGLTFRKNFRPFRVSGGVFYTYAAPGSEGATTDRKSTRLNSSHSQISYAVFCLKKKKNQHTADTHTDNHRLRLRRDDVYTRHLGYARGHLAYHHSVALPSFREPPHSHSIRGGDP